MNIKRCARCKKDKLTNKFAYFKKSKDKLQSYCQDCMTESVQIRYKNKKPPSLTKESLNAYSKKWLMNPNNKAARKMRVRNSLIVSRLSKNPDSVRDETIINNFGTDKKTFMAHFNSLFSNGMSWKNYGAWHLDHIKGLIHFNLLKESEAKIANHYENIRPDWGRNNLKRKRK